MDRISYFNKILEESFNNFLKKDYYESIFWNKTASIDNYINFMTDLDNFNFSFMINVIKSYLEYIYDIFFNTSYRRKLCANNRFYSRTILTLFGEVTFKRRYYYDNKDKEIFYFTDYFLNIPKRKYFDLFICANLCKEAASSSYSKSGKIIANKIGKRINNNIYISRASVKNIIMNFNIHNNSYEENINKFTDKTVDITTTPSLVKREINNTIFIKNNDIDLNLLYG